MKRQREELRFVIECVRLVCELLPGGMVKWWDVMLQITNDLAFLLRKKIIIILGLILLISKIQSFLVSIYIEGIIVITWKKGLTLIRSSSQACLVCHPRQGGIVKYEIWKYVGTRYIYILILVRGWQTDKHEAWRGLMPRRLSGHSELMLWFPVTDCVEVVVEGDVKSGTTRTSGLSSRTKAHNLPMTHVTSTCYSPV